MNEQRKIRVAVVFGGRSSEHPISCASAAYVLPAIDPERYDVVPIGIARDGRWLQVPGDPAGSRSAAAASCPRSTTPLRRGPKSWPGRAVPRAA